MSLPSEKPKQRVFDVGYVYELHGSIQVEAETEGEAQRIVEQMNQSELTLHCDSEHVEVWDVTELEE